MLIGGGKGILRVMWCDPSIVSDYIPVDVAIKAILIVAWKRGIKTYARLHTYVILFLLIYFS